jgi:DNA-binding response OmpR family regulator
MVPDILLVEDDPDLREEVASFLRFSGFSVRESVGIAHAASEVRNRKPDVALIDVLLPDGSGLALLPILRSDAPQCVNMMLSARQELQLKLDAYRQGADNYLVKPVDPRELVALLTAAIARKPARSLGIWVVDRDIPSILGPNGMAQTLTLQEAAVLRTLATVAGHFASRRQLIEALGHNYLAFDEQRLEAMISRLRKKLSPLGDNPVKAVHGKGYVFTQSVKIDSTQRPVSKH